MNNNKFKYVFEDDYNFYYADKIIYGYKKYLSNIKNPYKIKKWKLFSIEKINFENGKTLYDLSFSDKKEKCCYNSYTSIYCTEDDLINKFKIYPVSQEILVTEWIEDLFKKYLTE